MACFPANLGEGQSTLSGNSVSGTREADSVGVGLERDVHAQEYSPRLQSQNLAHYYHDDN